MITAIHDVTRDLDLVVSRNKAKQEEAKKVDPDTFPINKLTADYFEDFDSVWKNDKTLRRRVEAKYGHYLRVEDSTIDHYEAGKGVFVSCRR